MKAIVVALCCALAVVAAAAPNKRQSIGELVETAEQYRELFDQLHEDKEAFIRLIRSLIRAELHGLNESTLRNLANARNNIEDIVAEAREAIADRILEPGVNEQCLINLVNRVIYEGRQAGNGISTCAAEKINIKQNLGNDFYQLSYTLQRIATAAAEYTLYSYGVHDSVNDPQEHIDWLEHNYENQIEFWDNVARPDAQADLDFLEENRPVLVAENLACLNAVENVLRNAMTAVNIEIGYC